MKSSDTESGKAGSSGEDCRLEVEDIDRLGGRQINVGHAPSETSAAVAYEDVIMTRDNPWTMYNARLHSSPSCSS